MNIFVLLPTLDVVSGIAALLFLLKGRPRSSAQPPRRSVCEAAGRRVPIRFFPKVSKTTQDANSGTFCTPSSSAYGP